MSRTAALESSEFDSLRVGKKNTISSFKKKKKKEKMILSHLNAFQ